LRATRRVRQGPKDFQRAGELPDGLDIGRACDGVLPGLDPVAERLFLEASLGEVMGQKLGLRGADLGKLLREDLGDPLMMLLPRALEERVVGGIADERVL